MATKCVIQLETMMIGPFDSVFEAESWCWVYGAQGAKIIPLITTMEYEAKVAKVAKWQEA